jgi:hypothetical protein
MLSRATVETVKIDIEERGVSGDGLEGRPDGAGDARDVQLLRLQVHSGRCLLTAQAVEENQCLLVLVQ